MKKFSAILTTLIIVSSIVGTIGNRSFIFTSWWYVSLLLLMVMSLSVCSYNRFTYLIKTKEYGDVLNLNLKTKVNFSTQSVDNVLIHIKEILTVKKFSVVKLDNLIIAEKNSFNRWGSFIIHVGIIIIALGVLAKFIPGWHMNEFIWIKEGESYSIPNTNYYLENTHFVIEHYENGLPKLYQTNVQLKENNNNQVVLNYPVRVNQPIRLNQLSILQSDYQQIFSELNISIIDNRRQKQLGNITVDLSSPNKELLLKAPYLLVIYEYFPDLSLDKNNQPISISSFPRNPAFIFQIKNIETNQLSDKQWFILRNFSNPSLGQKSNYTIELNNFKQEFVSGLIINKDSGRIFVFTGLFISVIGLFISLYFQHKKIRITATSVGVLIEAKTNRNIEGLKLEIQNITEQLLSKEHLNLEGKSNDGLASNVL